MKHFNPDHHGNDNLLSAQKSMVLIAEHINQVKNWHKNTQKVQVCMRTQVNDTHLRKPLLQFSDSAVFTALVTLVEVQKACSMPG